MLEIKVSILKRKNTSTYSVKVDCDDKEFEKNIANILSEIVVKNGMQITKTIDSADKELEKKVEEKEKD